jgi:hypothetical protein
MFGAVTVRISRLPASGLSGCEWIGFGGVGTPRAPGRAQRFAQCVEGRRCQESPKSDWKAVERGWFLGHEAFKEELLAQMHERRGGHYGPELREADPELVQRRSDSSINATVLQYRRCSL